MKISNSTYDTLKFIALIVLPALASLYLGVGQLWGISETEKVVATIVLINTFLGALLQLSNHKFKKDPDQLDGYLVVTGYNADGGMPDLQLQVTPHGLERAQKHPGKLAHLKIGPPPDRTA